MGSGVKFGNRGGDADVISRVSTLEGHVERFHEDIRGLTINLAEFAQETRKSLNQIAGKASENKPIDIKIFGMAMTGCFFILSGFFSLVSYGYSKDITRLETAQSRDHEIVISHILKGGHVGMEARMKYVERDIEAASQWRHHHDDNELGEIARQASEIDAIQRDLYGEK